MASSLQHLGKATLRVAKNYTKGYSDVQAKVRDATSNDPWGPSGAQMNEIAQMTYNQSDFVEIMEMLDKRLNDKGKNWRHVFKALTLLDYCLLSGSENVVIYFRDNIYIIKTLKEFQYVDEDTKDQGANVRQKAKDITSLLQDESRLREARRNRASMRDRMIRGGAAFEGDEDEENENVRRRARTTSPPPQQSSKRKNKDEDDLRKAIEASKQSFSQEQKGVGGMTSEERDLQAAIRLSQEEEEARKRNTEDQNARSLFDDSAPVQSTNPFPLVDMNAGYNQQLQPQFTQYGAFNPYQQQLAEQEAQQAEYLRQQQQAEWMRQQQEQQAQAQYQAQLQQAQQEEWARQQQMQQQAQLQAQQEEWLRQQQQQQFFQQQQQQLQPQPTGFGSNNPFALGNFGGGSPQPQPPVPSLSPNIGSLNTNGPSPQPQPQSQPAPRPPKDDGQHAHLANLFANRDDGLDSFGNTGLLRYGHTSAGRLVSQQTGAPHASNPFARQGQQQSNEQPFFSI
ncbi:ENTH-domain-containing protein [Sistotremastrum suecicum HHB10207 ss-3]|uniref:ENTH-domain-containing protein n=1 Tax=Sistotremastrum suecicum HHB10207 ss-3 TaxID=1314776 RepID=A0A165YDC3_9AGAM|nr:ENTH-domain-containing protein [Sistotremastrum suecicum HHB10207 ss-3]